MQLGGSLLRGTACACVGLKQRYIDSASLGSLLDYRCAEHLPEGASIGLIYEHVERRLKLDRGDDTIKRFGERIATFLFSCDGAVGTVGRRFWRACRYL